MAAVAANLVFVLVVLAAAGLTLFGLPGNFLILAATIGYGWFTGFARFDAVFLFSLGGIFLLGEGAEFAAGALGAKRAKASGLSVAAACLGSMIGAVAGSLVLPLIGTVAGAAAGAFGLSYLAEYAKTGDQAKAGRAAKGAAIGLLLGTLCKIVVAISMAAAVIWRLFTSA